jgi:hypothetical protein
MAKESNFGSKQELQEYLAGLKQIDAQYKILNAEAKKLANVPGGAKNQVKQQLRDLQTQYDTHKEILASIKLATKELDDFEKTQQKIAKTSIKVTDAFKKQTESIEAQENRIKGLADNWDEIDGLQNSITSNYGKQYGEVKAIQKKIDGTKALISGISELIKHDSKAYGDQLDTILDIAEQYKGMPQTFATLSKERKLGLITEKQMSQQLKRSQDEFEEMVSKLQLTNAETEKLVALFKQLNVENAAFNKPIEQKSQGKSAANALITESPFGEAPIIGQAISKASETVFSEDKIVAASFIGLGFLAAKALATIAAIEGLNDGTKKATETYIGLERRYDSTIQNLELEIEARKKILELKSGFIERNTLFDFNTQLMQMGNEFNQMSKVSLFGGDLGEMPYLTEQMQLAGIGTETVVSAMHDLSSTANIGIFPQLAANAAVFAKKMGISTSELGTQIGMYRRLNKVGVEDATAGAQYQIGVGTIDPTTFSTDMAAASKLAMYYNIKSYQSLVKQVQAVRLLGASYADIGESGKNMVLNYKDSIKGEMELSAILGERVNLSTIRALFNANKTAEAFSLLKSSGLLQKAQARGPQAVATLEKALQGMDLQQLGAAPYVEGKKINTPTNAGFLAATQAATGNMKLEGARIDARQSIIQLQAEDLQRGLNDLFATDEMLTELEIQKIGTELNKFLDVTLQQIGEGITNPGGIFRLIANGGKAPTNPDILGVSRATNKLEGVGGLGTHPVILDMSQNAFDKTGKIATGIGGAGYKMGNTSIPTTGKGIDYVNRVPDKQQEIINVSKIQQQQLENLNSHTETSVELLKSLRDLTAIMLDPDRTKDFNVQLNMDGKQIHNVLIRNTKKLEGTVRGGGMSFATK